MIPLVWLHIVLTAQDCPMFFDDLIADFWPPKSGPERCHELKGEQAGTFSVDLRQPYRLLFQAHAETPQPDRSDEQQRWKSITAIDIFGIEDTHE